MINLDICLHHQDCLISLIAQLATWVNILRRDFSGRLPGSHNSLRINGAFRLTLTTSNEWGIKIGYIFLSLLVLNRSLLKNVSSIIFGRLIPVSSMRKSPQQLFGCACTDRKSLSIFLKTGDMTLSSIREFIMPRSL